MFDLARAYYFSLMFFTALSLNRSPLYTSVSYRKCRHQCETGHRWRVLCLNWDSASSTAYVPWDYRKSEVETIILSLLIRWVRHKRIDQAATPNLLPGVRGAWFPPAHRSPPHWQNSRTLNDTTLKCLDSHSGWTADAILYIVRSLHHQVFLEKSPRFTFTRNLCTCTIVASLRLPPANVGCWAGASRKLNDTEFISIRWAKDGLSEWSRVLSRRLLCFLSVMSEKLHILNGCMFFFF